MSYHINPRTGNIRECKANKKPCPYSATFHGETRQDTENTLEDLYEQYPQVDGSLDEWLRPGGSSQSGFMGVFETYDDLKKDAAATLAKYGTTTEEVGDLLERFNKVMNLRSTAARDLHPNLASDQFPDNLIVSVTPNFGSRGSQDCPFKDNPEHAKKSCKTAMSTSFITLKNDHTKIETNQLMGHLIREHGFFQGKHSEHHVEPERLAQMFGFQKQSGPKPNLQTVEKKLQNMRAKNTLPVNPKKIEELVEAALKTGDGLGTKVGNYTIWQVNDDSEYGRTMNGHIILQKDGNPDIVRLPYTRTEPYDGKTFYRANPEYATLVEGHEAQGRGYTYTRYLPIV